ncbi:UBX domain-containing protein 7, partial [Trichinella murrelli]
LTTRSYIVSNSKGELIMSEESAEQFSELQRILGCDDETARNMMQLADGNIHTAIELYLSQMSEESNLPSRSGDVLPPIPPTSGVLVNENFHQTYSTRQQNVSLRNFAAEAVEYRNALTGNGRPNSDKPTTLERLFRPPLELMYRGSWESARREAESRNRWLLVNVQDPQQFACQVLNRDVWSCSAIRDLIENNFIFWQVWRSVSSHDLMIAFRSCKTLPMANAWRRSTEQNLFPLVWKVVLEFLEGHQAPCTSRDESGVELITVDYSDDEPIFVEETEPKIITTNENENCVMERNGMDKVGRKRQREDMTACCSSKVTQNVGELSSSYEKEQLPPLKKANNGSSMANGLPPSYDTSWKEYFVQSNSVVEPGSVVSFMFRNADGVKHLCTFRKEAELKHVFHYAAQQLHVSLLENNFVLTYPRRVLSIEQGHLLLADLNLNSQEIVFIESRKKKKQLEKGIYLHISVIISYYSCAYYSMSSIIILRVANLRLNAVVLAKIKSNNDQIVHQFHDAVGHFEIRDAGKLEAVLEFRLHVRFDEQIERIADHK